MPAFTYPTSADLQEIEQDFAPRLTRDRAIFDLFPEATSEDFVLMWEQQDNYLGLTQVRGLNGEPPRVKKTPGKRYVMEPGVYGEFEPIDEAALTVRRRWGTFNQPVDIGDLVVQAQDKLLQRQYDRIEAMGWTLTSTGTFSVPGPNGAILHTDSYPLQTFTAAVPWSTPATSTPLLDFRAVQLLARGSSTDFGRRARAYMNQSTFNNLLANTNNADLYGRRTQGLATLNTPEDINKLFLGDNLPEIVPYDMGYRDENNAFQLFIPNNVVVVVGRRLSGAAIGDFCMTRNANNDDLAPGAYTKVIDKGDIEVPRKIEVHRGFNGGFRIYYPGAVVRMSV